MRRKIALIGPSTLMVSLPSSWAKKYSLKKGNELEIEENQNKLIISTEKETARKEITIDVSSLNTMLYRFIGAIYKSGYEQVKIIFNTPKQLEIIYEVLRNTCIGFETVEQTKNYIIIKEISKPEKNEFENILRRNFLFLMSIAKDSFEIIKNQNFEDLKNVVLKDQQINKYSDFCRRLLNKRTITENNSALYCIVEQLEKIADIYRELCKYIYENKTSLEKEVLEIYENINNFLFNFYEIFYKFDLEKIENFGNKRNEILSLIKNSKSKEKNILFYLNNIFTMTYDLNGALMTHKV
ncbi:phosphate uptake regulator PhoU [Candidatus Woesearchaeota archaeon]|nr:phosphate uptake regulator PhoU [Candidatus Woesearchaeota archaeon]